MYYVTSDVIFLWEHTVSDYSSIKFIQILQMLTFHRQLMLRQLPPILTKVQIYNLSEWLHNLITQL